MISSCPPRLADRGVDFSDLPLTLRAATETNPAVTLNYGLFVNTALDFIVRGDNTLALKVSKYSVVNLNVQCINETQVTQRTQVKETLAIGLS